MLFEQARVKSRVFRSILVFHMEIDTGKESSRHIRSLIDLLDEQAHLLSCPRQHIDVLTPIH